MKKICLIALTISLWAFPVGAATITGTVTYTGEMPKLRPIKMDGDPVCLTKHTEQVLPQVIELGEGGTLGNIFVHVTGGLPNQKHTAPAEEVVVTQAGCIYTPHVFGVMTGQTVKILNPDGTLHNVHAMSKVNPEFNLAMPKFRTEVTKTFDKPEMHVQLKCDVHPWMVAYMNVMEHPFFDTTEKEDGKFTIENLPAGTYEIEAWHEKLPAQKMSVTVAEGETQEVNFTFEPPAKN